MAVQRRSRWRFRYSLKALLLLVLLACLYLGLWESTKSYAAVERSEELVDTYACAPLVVYRDKYSEGARRYYLWLIVLEIELPYTARLERRGNAGTFP